MEKGIKAKDIRDFENCVQKLNAVMRRIYAYKPEAYIYATPQQLNLMAGVAPEGMSSMEEQDAMLVVSATMPKLEAGDW